MSVQQAVSQVFTITVLGPLTLVSTSPIPDAEVGVPYNYQFQATGGELPYTWTLLSGSLPTGLTLTSAGLLSGTPTAAGSFSPSIQVQESPH